VPALNNLWVVPNGEMVQSMGRHSVKERYCFAQVQFPSLNCRFSFSVATEKEQKNAWGAGLMLCDNTKVFDVL
jgi:hypothetical protein